MNVELTRFEAEILIAVLAGAEGSFQITDPPLVEAMRELKPFRSALIAAYIRSAPEAAMNVDLAGLPAAREAQGSDRSHTVSDGENINKRHELPHAPETAQEPTP